MLRRTLLLLAVVVCSLHAVADVRATGFDSSIMLDTDGTAVVNETITFASPQREFVRSIPRLTPGHEDTPLIIRVINVQNGRDVDLRWRTQRSRDRVQIFVDASTSVLRLTYLIPNATRFAGDHDEFIWPATDASLSIDRADIRVGLPLSAEGRFAAQAFTTNREGHRIALWSSTGALPLDIEGANALTGSPGPMRENVSITIGTFVNKGVLTPSSDLKRFSWFVGANRIVLLPFATIAVMMLIRRLRPQIPRRAIATCYEPPQGLTPAEVGTIVDDSVDARDVAATLADLAVRGYIRFDALSTTDHGEDKNEQGDQDFKITLLRTKEQWGSLAPHERTMLFHSFYGGHWTQLSSLRLRFPSIVPWFTEDVLAGLCAKGLYTSLPYSPWIICQTGFAALAALLFVAQLTGIMSLFDLFGTAVMSVAVSAVIIFLLGGKLSSKTRRGQLVWAEVRGFEEFLDRVDADRLARLTPGLYEKYLPYAMALGVERGWTAAFDGIAVPVPEWFGADGGITDPTKFHDTLHAFVTTRFMSCKTPKLHA
jgi:hypothetical protein